MKKKTNRPPRTQYSKIRAALNQLNVAAELLSSLSERDDAGEKLVEAVKALRAIRSCCGRQANTFAIARRAHGVANAALKRIGLP